MTGQVLILEYDCIHWYKHACKIAKLNASEWKHDLNGKHYSQLSTSSWDEHSWLKAHKNPKSNSSGPEQIGETVLTTGPVHWSWPTSRSSTAYASATSFPWNAIKQKWKRPLFEGDSEINPFERMQRKGRIPRLMARETNPSHKKLDRRSTTKPVKDLCLTEGF